MFRFGVPADDDPLGQSTRSFTSSFDAVEQNFIDKVDANKTVYNGLPPACCAQNVPINFFDPKSWHALREDQRGQCPRQSAPEMARERQDHGDGR